MIGKTTVRGKRRFAWVAGALVWVVSGGARALPLPDNSSCNVAGNCLRIVNSNISGTAIFAEETSNGIAVTGKATTGYGVIGSATTGVAVLAIGGTGNGVFSSTGGTATTISAVSGGCNANSGGCVGVKGTVRASSAGTAVFGDAANSSTAWAGYFVGDISAVDYFNNSDARLKKNIKPLAHATDSILKLRPVSYQWKRDETAGGAEHMGLIAQEVRSALPSLVREDEGSGMLGVNYIGIVPILIKSAQEQQATIQQQQAAIKRLEAQVEGLTRARGLTLHSSVMHPAGLLGGLALIPLAWLGGRRRRKAP